MKAFWKRHEEHRRDAAWAAVNRLQTPFARLDAAGSGSASVTMKVTRDALLKKMGLL